MTDDMPPVGEFLDEYASRALRDGHLAAWRQLMGKYIDRLAAVRFTLFTAAYGLVVYGLNGLTVSRGPFRTHTVGLGEAIMFGAMVVALMYATWKVLWYAWP